MLDNIPVFAQHDMGVRKINVVGRGQSRAGGGEVEVFRAVPRPALGLGFGLKIAAGHINADTITENTAIDLRRPNCNDKLDFVMQIGGVGRVGDIGAAMNNRFGGFGEEDGFGFSDVAAHFFHMLGVVLADAINPPDGEAQPTPRNGQAYRVCRREGEFHNILIAEFFLRYYCKAKDGETLMRIVDVPIDKIYVPAAKKKTLDEDKVMELAEDILENGLKNPIYVRIGKDRYVLQEGLHRVEAMKLLGSDLIDGHIVQAKKG